MSALVLRPLASPYIGALKNRVAMSAMTRGFADDRHRATPQIRDYYAKRAASGVGMILTEGVIIHPSGDGYNAVPHIATEEQAESWRAVIDAVHSHGTQIWCQLWHCGRISHSDYTGGQPPVSSTSRPASGINRQNNKPFGDPVALDHAGINLAHRYSVEAAKRAIAVGFDGVQIHLGHGYLADQFFDARVNDRVDEYGGSVENRCRFALELVEKTLAAVPGNQVTVRISPSRDMGGLYDWPDLDEMLGHFIPRLWALGVRVLDVSCARADYYQTSGRVTRMVRPLWPGLIMGGASLSAEQADGEISSGWLDIVTWGRCLIANPDLPKKIETGTPWVEFDTAMLKELS